jgi:hypothetical protein
MHRTLLLLMIGLIALGGLVACGQANPNATTGKPTTTGWLPPATPATTPADSVYPAPPAAPADNASPVPPGTPVATPIDSAYPAPHQARSGRPANSGYPAPDAPTKATPGHRPVLSP